MSFKLLIALAAVIVVAYGAATPATSPAVASAEDSEETTLAFRGDLKKNCQCMPFKYCDGEIDSDVECHPSYSHGCCIRPEPEPIPTYVPDNDINELDDFIQVVRI